VSLLYPWILIALPFLGLALWLLERWRRQPLVLVVADLELFAPSAASEEEAQAAERRLSWRFWARFLALALLVLAASGPRVAIGPRGALVIEVVFSRGLSASALPAGASESHLARHRAALRGVVESLRPDDRVRLHLVPGPPAALLTRNDAFLALEEVRPAAAEGDLAERLSPLLAPRPGPAPPVFCASERDPGLQSPRLQLALSGGPYRNRGLVALRRSGDTLHATLLGSPGPVEVAFAARTAAGDVLSGRVKGTLEAGRALLLSWSEASLPGAVEASARIVGSDAVASDDRAFAVASPSRARRVAVRGQLSPALRRALLAVEQVQLEVLPPGRAPSPGCDLLILNALPKVLPPTALAVVPTALPTQPVPGGPLRLGAPHPAWRHLAGRLTQDPAQVPGLTPPPAGLPEASPLLLAGSEPLVLVAGRETPEVIVLRAPASGPWTEREVFPLLWAELLEALAPQSRGELRAFPAGAHHPDLGRVPWGRPRRVLRQGRPLLGSVARAARPPEAESSRPFPADSLSLVAAARAPAPERDLAPWIALLAFPLLLAAAWPAASVDPRRGPPALAPLPAGLGAPAGGAR
jgi:aerotolerance regulator-like protein